MHTKPNQGQVFFDPYEKPGWIGTLDGDNLTTPWGPYVWDEDSMSFVSVNPPEAHIYCYTSGSYGAVNPPDAEIGLWSQ